MLIWLLIKFYENINVWYFDWSSSNFIWFVQKHGYSDLWRNSCTIIIHDLFVIGCQARSLYAANSNIKLLSSKTAFLRLRERENLKTNRRTQHQLVMGILLCNIHSNEHDRTNNHRINCISIFYSHAFIRQSKNEPMISFSWWYFLADLYGTPNSSAPRLAKHINWL